MTRNLVKSGREQSAVEGTSKYAGIPRFLAESGECSFRSQQLFDAVFRQRIVRFADMSVLPLTLRQELADRFGDSIMTLRRVAVRKSQQAEKALFEMPDGNRVEAIALAFQAGWESFCISSQSGCSFACSFCATGRIGLRRNMTADEITDQVLDFMVAGHHIDSVSFMAMGEPLSNKNIFPAIDLLTSPQLFALSPRRITVSTVGVVPAMQVLSRDYSQVNLTLSLHSPFDEQRSEMIPLNRKYPIATLMNSLDEHMARNRRKTYLAYILIDGVNDSLEHARALAALVKARFRGGNLLHVTLVCYNTAENITTSYQRSRVANVRVFQRVLDDAGVRVTLRASFGNDIDAACGQLYANYQTRPPVATAVAAP